MTAPNTGETFVLKVGGTKVAGQLDSSINMSTSFVDLSNKDTGGWRVKKPRYREWGSAATGRVYPTNTQYAAVRSAKLASTSLSVTFDAVDGGTWSGTAYVANLEEQGADEGDYGYSITLEGTGALTYTS